MRLPWFNGCDRYYHPSDASGSQGLIMCITLVKRFPKQAFWVLRAGFLGIGSLYGGR